MSFDKLGLSDRVLQAVEETGYITPTPIQNQAIPIVLMGRDVLGCAQTGTGKTAGFTLPMIDILSSGRAKARMPRSLILEPTRELAAQVAENFDKYGKHTKLTKALLIGGESFGDQEKLLDRGVDVLIATPGRLLDHFERGKVLLHDVKVFVIDESDRMLDMGFIPDIERIVGLLPPLRQTLLFSATMPKEIRKLADKFLSNPKEISVDAPATTAETIDDAVFFVSERDKRKALRALLRSEEVESGLIFCNRKRDVDILCRSLKQHDLSAAALHGDMPQSARMATLEKFRQGEVTLLVASDVAARGLDIPKVSHVFNFDVPHNPEDYVHRIGRTGRAGRKGRAFMIATPGDDRSVSAIHEVIKRKINVIDAPGDIEGRRENREGGGETPDQRKSRGRGGSRGKEKGQARNREDHHDKEKSKRSDADKAGRTNGGGKPNKSGKSRRGNNEKAPPMDHDGSEKGLGDHVPAFLQRPGRT